MSQAQPATASWWLRNRTTLITFVCLCLLLLAVIFWLPKVVAPNTELTAAPASDSATNGTTHSGTSNGSSSQLNDSPWQDAQLAKARRATQALLAKLLDQQQSLEAMQVNHWAAEAYAKALASAATADNLYKQRQFDQAEVQYTDALQQMEALSAQAEVLFNQALQHGAQALTDNQPAAALAAYQLASAIHPEHPDAIQGLQRAQVLEQVIALLTDAENLQLTQQWQAAKAKTEAALALDPQSTAAQSRLSELQKILRNESYSQLMGQGYSHLQNKNFSQAQTAFKQALQINPGDAAATQALAQTNNQQTQVAISRHMDSAAQQEQQEQWAAAHKNYEQALQLDKTLVAARIGQIRSGARAALDSKLQQAIAQPQRLQDDAVFTQTQALLNDARAIAQAGPRLQQQISQLTDVLEQSQQQVTVQFRSNDATQVTLYRVGSLGKFKEHSKTLKPGNYTLVGNRNGYRDVRKEITVPPEGLTQPVVIQCDEKITL